MSDLLQNFLSQAHGSASVRGSRIDGLGHVAFFRSGFDFQPSILGCMVIDVHVDIGKELPLEVVGAPTDDIGSAEFVTQVTDKPEGKVSLGLRDPEIDFQFFNTTFHVRSFASDVGLDSQLDLAAVAKGRPAVEVAA